jgi:Chaperone of endosialidase
MGGKTGTTTQQVSIPPDVLARYNSVNAQAQQTAQTPFQKYSTDPSAFVAQINQQQQQGISGINQYANAAQPAYNAAMQETAQAYQGFNAPNYQAGVAGYMSPYLQNALGATAAQLQNINQQQQQQLLGNTIQQGAFGGDRGKIAQAALINQQNLALGQTLGQMANQGYQSAAQNYLTGLGQQGALANQMGALGLGAQTAGLQGAQAQLGAGTLGQQTEQAGKTALYNQFLQQQSYPFQVAQFLANIAEGTGALSGSTTTTTQPMGFFSDERLKEGIKRIGETDDGQTIYKYRYKHDPEGQTHIGLMAQEVEKHNPDAVGLAAGYKTVDYDKATKDAESMGGGVMPDGGRQKFDLGGYASSMDPTMMAMMAAQGGYGQQGLGIVPYSSARSINIPMQGSVNRQLMRPEQAPRLQSGLSEAATDASNIAGLMTTGAKAYDWTKEHMPKQGLDLSQYPKADADTPFPSSRPSDLATGGLAGARLAYRDGQDIPYEDKDTEKDKPMGGLDIPDESPTAKLQAPGAAPQQQSGLSQLAQLASLGSSLGTLGSMASSAAPAIGEAAGSMFSWLPALLLATGGVAAGRRKYKDGKTVTAAPADDTANDNTATDDSADGVAAGADQQMTGTAIAPTFDNILNVSRAAIKKIEGGDYGITGPVTKHKVGDQMIEDVPLGAYGIMRSNVPSWTKEALGTEMTPEEFLANPKAQDAVFDYHFGKNLKQTSNPLDAASIWFTGKTTGEAGNVKDVLGTTNADYQNKFMKYSGLGAAAAPQGDTTTAKEGDQGLLGGLGSTLNSMPNETKLALLSGVFGMLASPSPFLLQAIGHGGLAGVRTYEDLTRLKNESIKNAQEFVANNFTTNDGVTWFSKLDGRTLNRDQYAAMVKQIYQNAGVGGGGVAATMAGLPTLPKIPGQTKETEVPTVAPPPSDTVQKAIETAKAPVVAAAPPPEAPKTAAPKAEPPPEAPSPPPEAPKAAAPPPEAPKKAADTATSPIVAYDEAAIRSKILNDPKTWANAAPNDNYPELMKQAQAQEVIRAKAQEDATNFAALTSSPVGGDTYKAKSAAALAQAAAAEKNRDRYYDLAKAAAERATSGPLALAKKQFELSATPAVVEPTLTGGTKTITQLQQLQDPSIIEKQNPQLQKKMQDVFDEDAKLDDEAQSRAIAHQRSNAIKYVLEHFNTGRWATEKSNAVGYLNSVGFNIPESGSAAPSSLDELVKLANGQVFDMMKGVNASKFTNLELGNLGKTNVNPDIMPDANGKIWAQNDAMLDYLDHYYDARLNYRKNNPNDALIEQFNNGWRKKPENDLTQMVNEKAKDIAPAGMTMPKDPKNLIDGKKYNIPPDPNRKTLPEGGLMYWDAEKNKFVTTKPTKKAVGG